MPLPKVRCRLSGLAFSFVLGLAAVSHSQTTKVPEKACGDFDTQAEMNDCAAQRAQEADAELDRVYRALLDKIKDDKTAEAKMIAAEKAWIAFRDAELAAEWPVAAGEDPNVTYGSVHPFCYYTERAAMTTQRVETLRQMMHHEEGDVCSPVVVSERGLTASRNRCSAFSQGHPKEKGAEPRSDAR